MLRSVKSAFAAALVMVLLGCGGGGGGGGASSPPPATTPEFTLTVEVGGVAATPDLAGKYAVLPGQTVVVKANEASTWVGNDGGSGVTRTDVDTGTAQWVSRFENPSAVLSGGYKLTANTSGGRAKTVDFLVQTGDYRNGDYTVFAGNGSRQTLSINFDLATYTMTDASGVTATGTLTAPVAPAKDWVVQSSRIGGVNTSSLRSVRDTIVGGFPFAVPFAGAGTYSAYPFVATRALVLTQSQLDGVFDRAHIQHLAGGGGQSTISQFSISGGGKVMKGCNHATIYQIGLCPSGNVFTFDVAPDTRAGFWLMKTPVTGAVQGRFSVATVEGEKILLSAGTSIADGSQVLSIGVPATTGGTVFTSSGWSTDGTLDVTNATAAKYEMNMTAAGPGTLLDLSLGFVASPSSLGIYPASQGGDVFFTMRSTRIELLIGARSSARAGFLHVGIVD